MESLLAHIARKERHRVRVIQVDVDKRSDVARRLGVDIAPTLVLVHGKRPIARIEGRASAPLIEAMLEQPALWREPCQSAVERMGEAEVSAALTRLGERRLRAKAGALGRPAAGGLHVGSAADAEALTRGLRFGPKRRPARRLRQLQGLCQHRRVIAGVVADGHAIPLRDALGERHEGTRGAAVGLVADVERNVAVEHVEPLVLPAVDVQRRLVTGADHDLADPDLRGGCLQRDARLEPGHPLACTGRDGIRLLAVDLGGHVGGLLFECAL